MLTAERLRTCLSTMLLAAYDLLAVIGATIIAIILRFEYLRGEYLTIHEASAPAVLATYLVIFYFFRLYRYRWQFAGMEMLWSVIAASTLATAVGGLWQAHIDGEYMPRSILIMTAVFTAALVGGQRLLLRVMASRRKGQQPPAVRPAWSDEPKRTVILADGQSADEVLMALARERVGRYDIIGILDDDTRHHGSFVRGYKILGSLDMLYDLLRQHAVDEVIVALPSAAGDQLREYALACCREKVAVRILPVIVELLENPAALRGRLRMDEVNPEDLLHRPSVQVPVEQIGGYLEGKRVLVTGAGGSIGSELCRQICRVGPEHLTILGHGENSIHRIESELRRTYPALAERITAVICDVRDEQRIAHVFSHYAPQVVFHAAAHKHVPMMEQNVAEAVTNNVWGTRNVIRAAGKHGVERMVLISTDKAVNPSSVMGATKFLCEEVMRDEATRSQGCFITVRFGNVLGSRGSVLPIFKEQLLLGGPLTITHPEMTRYFMTIPEAVSLALQAGAAGLTGSLFVLDMGRPVRIVSLAEDLIRLSGLEPYRDVGIEFCGLRPGEKLSEELFTEHEQRMATPHERLFIVDRPQYIRPDKLHRMIDDLIVVAHGNDDRAVLRKLGEVVPSFAAQSQVEAKP